MVHSKRYKPTSQHGSSRHYGNTHSSDTVIDGARSSKPRWSPVEPKPSAKQILHTGSRNSAQQSGNDDVEWFLSNAVLSEQLALPTTTDQEKGPLWKVQLNLVANDRCLVVLSTDHVINDGMGTLNLFRLLLGADDSPPPALTTSPTSAAIPPASDKIFSFKPSLGYMLGVVFDELILPILPIPKKLRAKLRGPVSWPISSPSTSKKRKAERNDRRERCCTSTKSVHPFTQHHSPLCSQPHNEPQKARSGTH